MSPGLLHEIALAGPEHLDPAYIAGYDRKAHFDPGDDLAMLRKYGLGSRSTLIDFGAGTGTFATAAADECRGVVAVDISPAMVAATRAKVAARGFRNIRCVQAGFLSYEHRGTPPDFVYTRNALHHLPDFWKALALRRMAELVRPGGVLLLDDLVFAFEPDEAESYVSAWLDSGSERSEDGWTRAELEEHLRREYSTFSWLLEPMIEKAGFVVEELRYAESRMYASYVCKKPDRDGVSLDNGRG